MQACKNSASTPFCLADFGLEYLLYQADPGSVTVDLPAGTYNYEWFHPSTGSVAGRGTVTVGEGNNTFTPPFSGSAVLYLQSEVHVTR
jgi:hypothetical protein